MMPHAESFRDLIVYQKARQVARRFFDLSKAFPKEERYSLTDQGRRSSRSIGALSKLEYFVHRSPITDHRSPITDHLSSYIATRKTDFHLKPASCFPLDNLHACIYNPQL